MSERSPARALGRLGRLIRKEVTTILRDRRTIITLVLMPLLLYPLLSIAFRQFLLASHGDETPGTEYILSFASKRDEEIVTRHLTLGDQALRATPRPEGTEDSPEPPPRLLSRTDPNPRELVRVRHADLALRVVRPKQDATINPGRERALELEVFYLEDSLRGRDALERVQRLLDAAHRQLLFQRRQFVREPLPDGAGIVVLRPLIGTIKDREAKGAVSLAALIPLVLILMTITGAVYPAIDLTAGERERGTLEILVAAPIPRLELLFAKYVSVVTVAVLTALVNLGTMTLTLQVSGLGSKVFGQGLSLLVVVQVFFLLLLFAAFFSALLLTVTSFARSFKEGQAYLIPLMLVSMAPGMVSLLPGMKLEGAKLVMPLLNIVLLARDLLNGQAAPGPAVIVVVSTLVYALAAVALAARVFGAEAVLYSEQGGWGDLFRRPLQPRPSPTLTAALFCLAVMFPASYVLQNLPGAGELLRDLLWKSGANGLLFLGIPFLFAWAGRVDLLSGSRLERSGIKVWGAAVLFGLCLWPFADAINQAVRAAGLGINERLLASLKTQWLHLRLLSPVLVVLCMAVVPAVLEELFFRGFLFGALRQTCRPRDAILASAAFFGLFHLVGQIFSVERGLNSTLLGLLLGWLAWKSGSVVPGILLHAVHNSTLILLAYYEPQLVDAGWLPREMTSVPVRWLLAGGAGATCAALWVFLAFRTDVDSAPEKE